MDKKYEREQKTHMSEDEKVYLCKKIIKENLFSDSNFSDFTNEFEELYNVLLRTIEFGESDSLLLIGPRGCGKTALLNNVIRKLKNANMMEDTVVIQLNGLIHTDDSLALKDIICQLHLESLDGDKVTGSFSDNLLFLLQSLRSGERNVSKPIIVVLDEFHLFSTHRNQTLLYNLFDAAQSAQAPICVVGLTCRIDVTELFEKRVKSRFSHRQIMLLKNSSINNTIELFQSLLTIDVSENIFSYHVDPVYIHCWNEVVSQLVSDPKVIGVIKKLHFFSSDQRMLRNFLFLLVSRMNCPTELHITPEDVVDCYHYWSRDAKITLLEGLSVLELCLVIAMTHQSEIYDDEPFNFEMILKRYLKFANQNSSVQIVQRLVILKAFERIKDLEMIMPINNANRVQKEYQLYNFLLTKEQVKEAVNNFIGLPTDVSQWALNSVV